MDPSQSSVEHVRSVADLAGEDYLIVLRRLHQELRPKTYMEIGTSQGLSLRLADCASIAIDPAFQLDADIVGQKRICALYQMASDRFFEEHDPKPILGGPIEMAFLDGMHRCEFLLRDFVNTERHCKKNSMIILHDCVPVEEPITDRVESGRSIMQHRGNWWLGDVWRTLLALKLHRADLRFTVVDAKPSGLACITNLNPNSTTLADGYADIVEDMLSWSLTDIGLKELHERIGLEPTSCLATSEAITRRFWL